jgi:double zinc ribbon protein
VAAIDVCEACGEQNPAGSAFCLYCGVYLGWDQKAGPKQSAPAQPGAPPVQEQQPSVQPVAQTAAAPSAGPAPAGYPTAPQPTVTIPAGHTACPSCGHPNDASRRFCGKCGLALRPSSAGTVRGVAPTQRQSWWQRFRDPADRRARREYRRSLPPLYRWRRVLVTLLVLAVAAGALYVAGKNPVGWAKAAWYDVRGTLVPVDGTTFTALPADSAAPNYDATALGTPEPDDSWATTWATAAMAPVAECAGQRATRGMVAVTFAEPVRVRRLEIRAGLPAENSLRPLTFRPSRLVVAYGPGQCAVLELRDDAGVQAVDIDTGTAVSSLRLAVGAAYPARADGRQNLVALSGVRVLSRPN